MIKQETNDQQKLIIGDIAKGCSEYGVGFFLSATETVVSPDDKSKIGSVGFFDEEVPMLAIGTKRPIEEWFPTLIHESQHMEQWKEHRFGKLKGYTWEWLGGKKISKEKVKQDIMAYLEIELDCEKRTTKVFEGHIFLGIHPIEYVRKANAYLYFYQYILKNKKWYKKPPYEIFDIKNLMPDNFLPLEDYLVAPEGYNELIEKHCL